MNYKSTVAFIAILAIVAVAIVPIAIDDQSDAAPTSIDATYADGVVSLTFDQAPSALPATVQISSESGDVVFENGILPTGTEVKFRVTLEEGNYTIAFTQGALSLSCNLTVEGSVIPDPDVTLESIEVTTMPDKVEYTEGENFDATGMVVTATYSDETTKPVTNYTISGGDNLAVGTIEVTISYTEGDITVETTVGITVTESETPVDPDEPTEDPADRPFPNTITLSDGAVIDSLSSITASTTQEVIIAGDVTVAAGGFLDIYGKLTIQEGASLTIEQDGNVYIQKDGVVDVQGDLVAEAGADEATFQYGG